MRLRNYRPSKPNEASCYQCKYCALFLMGKWNCVIGKEPIPIDGSHVCDDWDDESAYKWDMTPI